MPGILHDRTITITITIVRVFIAVKFGGENVCLFKRKISQRVTTALDSFSLANHKTFYPPNFPAILYVTIA